mmetsp:Transcript_32770/g.59908  ORF Transcript_32770/g.59908 Transcript_32770/m.59908 type:complete len:444 (-) Transcript_32770:92-1423(-)
MARLALPVDELDADSQTEASPRRHTGDESFWEEPAPSPRAWHFMARKPRDGPLAGGGHMRVFNPVKVAELSMVSGADALAFRSKKRRGERSRSALASEAGSSSSTMLGDKMDPGLENIDDAKGLGAQDLRRKAELQAKFVKTATQRQRDRESIAERLERSKTMRDDRFNRMVEHVLGRDNLAYQAAMAIRERDSHQERRRRELHAAYDEAVAQPLADQLFNFMNPPNRLRRQVMTGTKSVDFLLPGARTCLAGVVEKDPVKQTLVDLAKEGAFHNQCLEALGPRAHSAPAGDMKLRTTLRPRCDDVTPQAGLLAKGRSRPSLEPNKWGQVQLQGTMLGHFAQSAEYGPGFRRVLRGGSGIHAPDENDGVEAAGKRTTRATGHKDLGILKGEICYRGQASMTKTMLGSSSGAILQDHYQFERGPDVVNMEFPAGKRCFPGRTGA